MALTRRRDRPSRPYRPRANELSGIAFGVAAAIAFGTLAIIAKLAYRDDAQAIPLLAPRFGIAAALLVCFHLSLGRSLRVSRGALLQLLTLGGVFYAAEASLFFIALERAPAGTVSLIFYSFPVLTSVLAVLIGLERFDKRMGVALAAASAGVMLIFSVDSVEPSAAFLSLGAALGVALYFILAQILVKGIPAPVAATWTCLGAAASLALVSASFGRPLPRAAYDDAVALGLATAIAFACLYAAIARLGSSRASIAVMVEPVTTVILATLFLSERMTGRIALGAILVVSALPILARAGRSSSALAPPDSA